MAAQSPTVASKLDSLWRHFENNSPLLLRHLGSLALLRIAAFSARHKPQSRSPGLAVWPDCPMDGQCLKESMVYRADVLVTGAVNETRFYLGQCSGKFKTRYGNHLKSLRHERYKDETALSSYIWDAQRRGGNVSIKWSIVAIVPAQRILDVSIKEESCFRSVVTGYQAY